MSVFNDFQRLWMQRFPQSSLSDAWECDVRASLERHKQKIAELSKELEQETLYVEYLERLLSDVEKYRETGGDPTALFEAATNSASSAATTPQQLEQLAAATHHAEEGTTTVGADAAAEFIAKSSLNLRDPSGENRDKSNRLSLNTDNKYANNSSTAGVGGGGAKNNTAITPNSAASASASHEEHSFDKEDKDVGTEKDTRNGQKNGALQQCITELAASINSGGSGGGGEASGRLNPSTTTTMLELKKSDSQYDTRGMRDKPPPLPSSQQQKSTSHFVTVIEVKESRGSSSTSGMDSESAAATAGSGVVDNSSEFAAGTAAATSFSSFERRSTKVEPTAPPLSPALTSPMMSSSSYAAHLDAKKKMPPRPPPKNIRRVEPPTIPGGSLLSSSPKREAPFMGSTMPLPNSSGSFSSTTSDASPANSLERNIKPSDILRQKSSESLEAKTFASNRKTTPEMSRFANTPELLEEFGRKIGKTESLEKKRTVVAAIAEVNVITESPTGSLGRALSAAGATNRTAGLTGGSLNKTAKLAAVDSSSTGSLDKKSRTSLQASSAAAAEADIRIGSKESLASGQGISEIIKSYESVSSLSSDSAKVAAHNLDNEPYYDTVPLDNGGDGEYVYIKPGGTGSSSSRDDLSTPGSTFPMGSSAAHHLSSQASVTDPESPGRTSNYVNIDYFLHPSNETRSSSLDSDGEYEGPPIMRAISHDEQTTSQTPGALRKLSGNVRGAKIRKILTSIIHSETIYVECLNKMIQYKRAIHATIATSQPVIKKEEEDTIFYKIEELYDVHTAFLADLKAAVAHEGGDVLIGETFKRLADMFKLYSAFLHNYGQAIDTVKKCSANNPQFKEIVSTIVLNLQTEKNLTLEDLLHKPVARVQINALVFNDLLHETPPNHPDHQPLRQAHKTIHLFLKEFNVVKQRLPPAESNKNLRRMVKNSFIVELVDNTRKLRHLFLFNDFIACAKYNKQGRDSLEYELKWFVPLKDVIVFEETDASAEFKEANPANILQLKTQACTVRDQLLLEEKAAADESKARNANGLRASDKIRRKLNTLQNQLVLASPNLVFRIGNKATNKTITFFLSSDYERTHWIDSIMSLKETCNIPGAHTINSLEVSALLVAIQKSMKTEMGSYLMRNTNDESLLVGDLHITVQGLTGLEQPADLYICIEVDSYGNYFRKATTKMVCRSMNPVWNENFVLELEDSQNVRILLYEAQERPKLKAKHVLKLSCSWLQETATTRVIKMGETTTLNTILRFVPGEVTLRRVPTSKPGALFGAKMCQVLKREKRDIPFIISACIREVERRGMSEVGIYRVSGSASDLAKLKKSFETNAYEAEQLLKDVDIHSVTGILKSYLRDLPEALFSDALYPKFFETYSAFSNNNETARINELLKVFERLPEANRASINHILDHLIRVHHQEADNKMSLHNLAMVFGPTLLRPGQTQAKPKDLLASSTVDVMAQAGILYCFLQARIKND